MLVRASALDRAVAARRAPAIAHAAAFEREHLRSYFEGGLSAPFVLLRAPLGYGKTTALAFLARHEGGGAKWATLRESDAETTTFVSTVMSAIYEWEVERPPDTLEAREAAVLIAGAIEELGVTTLVLDDYETVAGSEMINAVMYAMAERLPAYVRIAVASEVVPEFVRLLRLRQAVVELVQSDLRFDADDVVTFLRDFHHYEVQDATAAAIARRTSGCATVVGLVGQLVHDLPRYLRVDFDALPLGSTDQHMAPLLREVLARTGFPPARAGRDLAGVDVTLADGTSPADTLLDMLSSRNCLAQLHATEPRTIVPHALLRRLAPLL